MNEMERRAVEATKKMMGLYAAVEAGQMEPDEAIRQAHLITTATTLDGFDAVRKSLDDLATAYSTGSWNEVPAIAALFASLSAGVVRSMALQMEYRDFLSSLDKPEGL